MSGDVGARLNGALGNRASARQAFGPLVQKLRSLGVNSGTELDAVLNRIEVRAGPCRGEDIVAPGGSPRHSTLLLEGVACLYERLPDGNRQIYAFQYPGDFCDLHRHVGANHSQDRSDHSGETVRQILEKWGFTCCDGGPSGTVSTARRPSLLSRLNEGNDTENVVPAPT